MQNVDVCLIIKKTGHLLFYPCPIINRQTENMMLDKDLYNDKKYIYWNSSYYNYDLRRLI